MLAYISGVTFVSAYVWSLQQLVTELIYYPYNNCRGVLVWLRRMPTVSVACERLQVEPVADRVSEKYVNKDVRSHGVTSMFTTAITRTCEHSKIDVCIKRNICAPLPTYRT